jgi:hypothetical protein
VVPELALPLPVDVDWLRALPVGVSLVALDAVLLAGRLAPLEDAVPAADVRPSAAVPDHELEPRLDGVDRPGTAAAPVADDVPPERPEVVPDDGLVALPPADADEPADVTASACAVPDPVASAAPTPRATAPAPSHTWVSVRRCWARWRPFLRFGGVFARRSSATCGPPSLATPTGLGRWCITNAPGPRRVCVKKLTAAKYLAAES